MDKNINIDTYNISKEKGFISETPNWWPTQTELQKWLREEHKIRVFPEQKTAGDFGFKIYVQNPEVEKRAGVPWIQISYFTHHFLTYEEALEAGISEGLKLIEKN